MTEEMKNEALRKEQLLQKVRVIKLEWVIPHDFFKRRSALSQEIALKY